MEGACQCAHFACPFYGTVRFLVDNLLRVVIKHFAISNVGRRLTKDGLLSDFRPKGGGFVKYVVRVLSFVASFRGRNLSGTIPFRHFRPFCGLPSKMVSNEAIGCASVLFVRHVRFGSIIIGLIRDFRCNEAVGGNEVTRCTRLYVQGVLITRNGYVFCSFKRAKVYHQFSVANGDRCVQYESILLRIPRTNFGNQASFFTHERQLFKAVINVRTAFAMGAIRNTCFTIYQRWVCSRECSRATKVGKARCKK